MILTRVCVGLIAVACMSFASLPIDGSRAPASARKVDDEQPPPRVGIRFEGFLPGTRDEKLAGDFDVEFRIYLSPQGGDAVWRETRKVQVVAGRMDVELGEVNPIPFEIHRATFKFLGASVGGAREVYPRFSIVNTVFASPEEALRPPASSPETQHYAKPRANVAAQTEVASTWEAALRLARERGGDLPDYRDWYADLARCDRAQVLERSGHYEWVAPWVYDTASHGEYNRLFRGRFQGCDYMDLSPENKYVFRVATPVETSPASSPRTEQR